MTYPFASISTLLYKQVCVCVCARARVRACVHEGTLVSDPQTRARAHTHTQCNNAGVHYPGAFTGAIGQ